MKLRPGRRKVLLPDQGLHSPPRLLKEFTRSEGKRGGSPVQHEDIEVPRRGKLVPREEHCKDL